MAKRYIYIFPILATLSLLLGCAREGVKQKGYDMTQGNTVYFTLKNAEVANAPKDLRSSLPVIAEKREQKITSLHALFFYQDNSTSHHKGQLCKAVLCTPSGGSEASYKIEEIPEGKFFFYLVANASDALVTKMQGNVHFEEEFFRLMEKDLLGDVADISDFLMLSSRHTVQTFRDRAVAINDPILLERAAVRYDIHNEVDGLVITEITFRNRNNATYLSTPIGPGKNDDVYEAIRDERDINMLYKNLNLVGDRSLASPESKLLGRIYSYEYLRSDEVWFEFGGAYHGVQFREKPLIRLELQPKRNNVYTIILKEVHGNSEDPKSPIDRVGWDLKINDWSQGERIDFTVPGSAGSEDEKIPGVVPDPARDDLVKNYIDYSVELPYASFVNPYLKRKMRYNGTNEFMDMAHFSEVYTLTKDARDIYLKVRTKDKRDKGVVSSDPSLQITEISSKEFGVNTRIYETTYKISLPPHRYCNPSTNASGKYESPQYKEFVLTMTNASDFQETLTIKHGTPRMALDYVAEKNLAPLPSFSYGSHTSYDFSASANYRFARRNDILTSGFIPPYIDVVNKLKSITLEGKQYRLARSSAEWTAILPIDPNAWSYSKNSEDISLPSMNKIGEPERTMEIDVHYKNGTRTRDSFVSYALKARDPFPELQIAYRYEWVGSFDSWQFSSNNLNDFEWTSMYDSPYLKVTARRLGPNFKGKIEDIATEAFWNTNQELDVVREFPFLGQLKIYTSTGTNSDGSPWSSKRLIPTAGGETYFITEALPFPSGASSQETYDIVRMNPAEGTYEGTKIDALLVDTSIWDHNTRPPRRLYENTPEEWQKVNQERRIHRFFPVRLIEVEP